jgi:hypothetical protein
MNRTLMKSNRVALALTWLIACNAVEMQAQGTFQNLSFDNPVPPLIPGGTPPSLPAANAIPGWNVFIGSDQQSQVLYNSLTLGSSAVALLDSGFGSPAPIQGSHSIVLIGGLYSTPSGYVSAPASISQMATISGSSVSVFFKAQPGSGNFFISVGGVTLPVFAESVTPNYTLFGADISNWSGQAAELKFTAGSDYPSYGLNILYLDDIQFSNQPIPEPSALSLLVLGALCLGWRWRRS